MTGPRRAYIAFLACVLIGLLSWHATAAEGYPNRPVTIVVPFTPHGSTDILGRYAAAVLQRALHQSFIVENRAGDGGLIGINYVAKSAPDGYTLLNAPSVLTFLPYLNKSVSYDLAADFDPIVLIGLTEYSLVVTPSLNVNSVQDLIALAKAKPGVLTYASAEIGSPHQLFAELFKSMANVDIRHVPYNGVVPALPDVTSGQSVDDIRRSRSQLANDQRRQAENSSGRLERAQPGHAQCPDHWRDPAGLRSARLAGPAGAGGYSKKHCR